MSERGSFTTEYIYNDEDYKTMREALDQNGKYLCISPPATWSNGDETFEMPIVSGKVGELTPGWEYETIIGCIKDVKTNFIVRIVVMCDNGDIYLLCKEPDPQGWVDYTRLKENEGNL